MGVFLGRRRTPGSSRSTYPVGGYLLFTSTASTDGELWVAQHHRLKKEKGVAWGGFSLERSRWAVQVTPSVALAVYFAYKCGVFRG